MLTIDNAERTAPAAFNDTISWKFRARSSVRKARPTGSTARKCAPATCRSCSRMPPPAPAPPPSSARARSARSSPAKPQARRRILEDAAGIAGLHARRHEAELRLKAAEDNLVRVEDVIRELESQIESLKRQGRQASRYKNLSAEIRRLEALMYAISFSEAREQAADRRARRSPRI